MQWIFSNALSRAVAKHIDLSATRRETLSWLALLIMQHGTISLRRLADPSNPGVLWNSDRESSTMLISTISLSLADLAALSI
jgi:hypothetical protein